MGEEAQTFTSLTGWQLRSNLHDRLECWLCFANLDSADVVPRVGKGHLPGRYFTDGSHAENFPTLAV